LIPADLSLGGSAFDHQDWGEAYLRFRAADVRGRDAGYVARHIASRAYDTAR
jgi:hypothetical protein